MKNGWQHAERTAQKSQMEKQQLCSTFEATSLRLALASSQPNVT